ncbi:MAG: MBOAT family O-acyltransferase [Coriobacteriia bacterium]
MTFASFQFGVFVAVTFAAYWLLPRRSRPALLLLASAVFYTWAFAPHAVLLATLVLGAYAVGKRVEVEPGSRATLLWGIAASLATLAFFKYLPMLTLTANGLLGLIGVTALPVPSIAAPLGLSYVTFGLVHYLVSVRKGEPAADNLVDMSLYVAFFPTITAGPIKRYPEFMADLAALPDRPVTGDITYGLVRIVVGLAKKIVIADTVAILVTPLHTPGSGHPLALLIGVYAYAIQLYFDFSGYSDMAIGISRLFGFRILENFSWPYLRRNLSQFWRSWHISLSRLITEYVYIPLGGSRRGTLATARNTLIAMAASGLWHGAAWHFVAWGVAHGAGLVVLRAWNGLWGWLRTKSAVVERVSASRVGQSTGAVLGWAVTFNFVVFAWVLFLLPMSDAWTVYTRTGTWMLEAVLAVVR